MNINTNNIVSSTDLVKNYSKIRNQVKANDPIIVFKNNKPDITLIDFDTYQSIVNFISDIEHNNIYDSVKPRLENYEASDMTIEDMEDLVNRLLNEPDEESNMSTNL